MRTLDDGDAGPIPYSSGPPAELGPPPASLRAMAPRGPYGADLARPLPPAMTSAPNIGALLKALRRQWAQALGLGLVCGVAAAAAAWFLVPAKFTSQSLLHLSVLEPNLITDDGNAAMSMISQYKSFQKTQQSLILSGMVLNTALGQKNPNKPGTTIAQLPLVRAQGADPIFWLQKRLTIELEGEIMIVSLSGDGDPLELKTIVDAVTDAYIDKVVNREQDGRKERVAKLNKIHEGDIAQLQAQRLRLRNLTENVGSDDRKTLTLKQQFELERLSGVEKLLTEKEAELREAEAEYKVRSPAELGLAGPSMAAVDEWIEQDKKLQEHRARILELQGALDQHTRVARNRNDAAGQKLRREMQSAARAASERRKELLPVVRTRLHDEARKGSKSDIQAIADRVAILTRVTTGLRTTRDQLEKANTLFARKSAGVEALQEEIKLTEESAERVGNQMRQLEIELQAPARIELIAAADLPTTKEIKKQVAATVLAGFGAMAMVMLGIAWWQVRAGRIDSVDEVVNGLGLRVVGALPALPVRARRALDGPPGAIEVSWRGQLTESVNAMRALLLRLSQAEPLQVVMVTSAVGGEGKTTLSSHLATSLARAGRRTLLIDGDMRKPAMHRVFDLPEEPGLAELLRGQVDPADAIRPTLVDKLWMVPAGLCDEQALQALGQDEIRMIFDRLRGQYDFIIVDTPPVLPVADALLLSQHVDGTIFAILGDVSRIPRVYGAYERLAALGVRMLGAVVIGARGHDHLYTSDYPYMASAGR